MAGLWVPLAFTFLLMSGSSPIVSAGINRLPGSKEALKEGLAVFCDAFRAVIFLHAPCFVVRDIAIRSIRDRRTYLRTLGFVLAVAAVCSTIELILALTPLGDLFLRNVVGTPEALIPAAKRAILVFSALPFLIGVRGIHQGIHIHGETTVWVGIGTALRMTGLALSPSSSPRAWASSLPSWARSPSSSD